MLFQIPEDLSKFSANGIRGLIEQAEAEYNSMKATYTTENVTDEALEDLKALREFYRVTGPQEIATRERRQSEFAKLDEDEADDNGAEDGDAEGTEDNDGPDTTQDDDTATEAVTASAKAPKISDVKKGSSRKTVEPEVPAYSAPRYSTLIAAAGVPDYDAGAPLASMLDVAKAFESRSAPFTTMAKRASGGKGEHHVYPVAKLVRDYPDEFSIQGDETDYEKLLRVADESRLPGGSLLKAAEQRRAEIEAERPGQSLVAAAGWCAPSETDYSICLQISTDGLLDAPEVQARRGGIRHNTGIEFDSIFGSGTGFFDLTEAQVAAGTEKTCLEIPCPSFVDTRLGVTGLCLTGNILSIRGYPEFTAAFTRGALAASAHQINREQIEDIVADSTAVDLTGAAPWATDGSTVSQVMSAVEMAIVDIKYRLRLQQSATLEVILPFWVLAMMRADWIRRTGMDNSQITLADAAINAAFSARGARAQYVYDWQDAFSNGAASGVGADTPISTFNEQLDFIVYPAGTWVRAVSDVITLNSVYDSTLLATNQVTHLFTETGWAMVRMCPVSRVYTTLVCPSGKTTSTGTLTCP